jgi:hypothetical protein
LRSTFKNRPAGGVHTPLTLADVVVYIYLNVWLARIFIDTLCP